MAKPIYDVLVDEMKALGLVEIPFLAERMSASIGAHVFNLNNLDAYAKNPANALYDCGKLENFRLHMLLMSPSGFGRTLMFSFALDPNDGILKDAGFFDVGMESTFSKESWAGTASQVQGKVETKQGIFSRYKRGILGADEFMRFVGLMDPQKVDEYSNEEVYLLKGLDEHTFSKNLSFTTVSEDGIGTTMWIGSRIAKIDMKHGLARRILLHLFTPMPSICKKYKESMRLDNRKAKISQGAQMEMKQSVVQAAAESQDIKRFDYSELNGWLDEKYPGNRLPHFEETIIRRIAVGFSVARNTMPDIVIDEPMKALIQDELKNRAIMRGDPDREVLRRIVYEAGSIKGNELKHFLGHWYQYSEDKIRFMLNELNSMREVKKEKMPNKDEYTYTWIGKHPP